MQFHFPANQSHFHKNGFALRLALKQRHMGTFKMPKRNKTVVCHSFIFFFTAVCDCHTAFVCTLITEEVSTLFRGTSLTTTLMDQYMKMVAIPYLQKTIGDVVAKILECKQSCEV